MAERNTFTFPLATNDAIKFIRWGQHWIDRAGRGILAFVTPNTWLSGLTHRRMRESLLSSFDELQVVDLHGEAGGPAGDENVFGVRSGVAIVVFVKRESAVGRRFLLHTDLIGPSRTKFAALSKPQRLRWRPLVPTAPDWQLAENHQRSKSNYATFWPLDRIFRHYISGVQTKNDAVFVAFTRDELTEQVCRFLGEHELSIEFDPQCIQPYLVAPFDRRFVYYDPRLIGRARYSVMRHMLRQNLGLVFMRQSTGQGEYDHFLAVDCLVSDRAFYSRHGAPFLAPLWLEEGSGFRVPGSGSNLQPEFADALDANDCFGIEPVEVFHYLYAVAHSPAYRRPFASELRRGFPRFPLPRDRDTFCEFCKLGRALTQLHLGTESREASMTAFEGDGGCFRVGGYNVLRRWQTPRIKRGWTAVDDAELERLSWIGGETRRLIAEIDKHSCDQWSHYT
jgi:predicted helicase